MPRWFLGERRAERGREKTHRFVCKSEVRYRTRGLPMWMRRCWPPSPRRGCSHRRRWHIGRPLCWGRLFRNPSSMRSSPSFPSTSTGSGIPRIGSCVGSSMSGAWSYNTSIRLGCRTSPASSPSMRPSLGWSRTWASFGRSSPGEPCRLGLRLLIDDVLKHGPWLLPGL